MEKYHTSDRCDYDDNLNHVKITICKRLFSVVLIGFLSLVVSESATWGDLLSAPNRTVDLFESLRGRNLSNLTRQEVGDIGEDVARRLLGENGFTDIISVQNRSGNGIDIVAHASDGRLVFFEVKLSRIGQVGNLSTRQQSMTSFIEDVLGQASTGTGRYRNLDAAAQDTARSLLREFRRDPLNVSGNAVGVDLLNEIIRISPWR